MKTLIGYEHDGLPSPKSSIFCSVRTCTSKCSTPTHAKDRQHLSARIVRSISTWTARTGWLAWVLKYLAKQPDAQRMESAIHVAQLAAESAAAKALSGYNATAAPAFVVNLRKVDLDIAPLDLVSAITKILEEQGQ